MDDSLREHECRQSHAKHVLDVTEKTRRASLGPLYLFLFLSGISKFFIAGVALIRSFRDVCT